MYSSRSAAGIRSKLFPPELSCALSYFLRTIGTSSVPAQPIVQSHTPQVYVPTITMIRITMPPMISKRIFMSYRVLQQAHC